VPAFNGSFLKHVDNIINNMSQKPQKRNKDSKEAAENRIEQSSGDEYPATKPVEEVAGQRDTKSADAADSSDSMIV
jgi:hypothetical protein